MKRYLHMRIEVSGASMGEFLENVERLRVALDRPCYHYGGWIWTDDPRPANPLLYEEYRQVSPPPEPGRHAES